MHATGPGTNAHPSDTTLPTTYCHSYHCTQLGTSMHSTAITVHSWGQACTPQPTKLSEKHCMHQLPPKHYPIAYLLVHWRAVSSYRFLSVL